MNNIPKIIILISFIFFSCNSNHKTDLENSKKEVEILKKRIREKEIKIDSLQKLNTDLKQENSIPMEVVEYLLDFQSNNNLVMEHLVKVVKKKFENENGHSNFHESFHFTGFLGELMPYIEKLNGDEFNNKSFVTNYIVRKFNRNPKNIRFFFDYNKKTILHIIESNKKFYKDCGLQLFVKCLLLSYQESIENKEVFLELFKISSKYSDYTINRENPENIYFANELTTETIHSLYEKENLNSSDEKIYRDKMQFMFYVYSFWARRMNENNQVEVYRILKEIDEYLDKGL